MSGAFMKSAGKLLTFGIRALLGNYSMGEYESSCMFIAWNDNALLRCDVYCYRWDFSAEGVFAKAEGVLGVLLIQRVIDMTKTDPQVLTWAISRQAEANGEEQKADAMIDQATALLKKVASFQRDLKALEIRADTGETEDNNPS